MNTNQNLLVEIAWEVCNQVGGIYTVVRSKVPAMVERWGNNYLMIGTYLHANVLAEFEPSEDLSGPFGRAVFEMRERGYEVHYGTWLVSGRPKVVLFNPFGGFHAVNDTQEKIMQKYQLSTWSNEELVKQVIALGVMVKEFLSILAQAHIRAEKTIVAHFHEWMTGLPIADLRQEQPAIKSVFTTHATMLGRYLAMNDPEFYDHLNQYDSVAMARHFGIEAQANLEKLAAQTCHVFTTVSDVTAEECKYLLGREPDQIVPNGLNIERFVALHEFQNLHQQYKEKINNFIMGHFFHSYSFDLDNTLFFFTSGRYEFRNKGFDVTLEALARLNYWMQQSNSNKTVVFFFITKRPVHTINPIALNTRAVMEELRATCDSMQSQIKEKLFKMIASGNTYQLPDLNAMIDDYWKLRLRRTMQSWKSNHLPIIVTHNLQDDQNDEILADLRKYQLLNYPKDKVKIVYHPDFVAPTNPLFGMEYGQFVRGCHLGVFPSYYEPWGYTPLECIASGIATITSDVTGFGDYVKSTNPNHTEDGIYLVNRRHRSHDNITQQIAENMFAFTKLSRRERIAQRNRIESQSVHFDWSNLAKFYDEAHALALQK
jgi:glycogen synthase